MNIAVITDTNSGMTIEQGKKERIEILPMPFIIKDQIFSEGIDFDKQQFYQLMIDGEDISTSQPTPDTVTTMWDRLLKKYDQIVHIPMSSGLSGACETAYMLAQDYQGKVEVVDNQRISATQRQSAQDARRLADQGMNAAEIRALLEKTKFDSSIYVMVDTLKYLKKGGRITPAAAALGTLLKIKPVLTIQGEKLDAFAKARTIKQAKSIMIAAIQKDLEERFDDKEAGGIHLQVVHGNSPEAAAELKAELRQLYPHTGEITIDDLSLSVTCHTGPGALAIALTKKLIKDENV